VDNWKKKESKTDLQQRKETESFGRHINFSPQRRKEELKARDSPWPL